MPFHADGARLWESQPFLDHSLPEITALFDSVYVSFYKGLRAMAGAAVACDEDVAGELRAWRQRMGGTLFGMTPYALSALVGLRDELPLIGDSVAWARSLAEELVERGLRVQPDPPHTNTFLVFADGDPDAITERVTEFMEKEHVAPCGRWWAARAAGRRHDRGDDPPRCSRQGPGHGRRLVRRLRGLCTRGRRVTRSAGPQSFTACQSGHSTHPKGPQTTAMAQPWTCATKCWPSPADRERPSAYPGSVSSTISPCGQASS